MVVSTGLKILYTKEFYSATHKEEWNFVICMKIDGVEEHYIKWSQSGSEDQKLHVFSHLRNTDLILIQQHYEKQITPRGGHIGEGE
jgi:hypothetical protein